jgi:hypothetical protein
MINKNIRISNEFKSFSNRILKSKHKIWFDLLDSKRKFELFLLCKRTKRSFKNRPNTFSMRKFLFKQRENRKFHIPKVLLRDGIINKILTK